MSKLQDTHAAEAPVDPLKSMNPKEKSGVSQPCHLASAGRDTIA